MINFFRKIRQRLLTENKFSKYLLYAIGEIFLVVIGILIALSINNWNEGRKNKNKAAVYVTKIINDLQNDINNLDSLTTLANRNIAATERYFDFFENQKVASLKSLIDSSKVARSYLTKYRYVPVRHTFEDMKSSGNSTLLSEVQREALIKLYNTQDFFLIVVEKTMGDIITEEVQTRSYLDLDMSKSNFFEKIGFERNKRELTQGLLHKHNVLTKYYDLGRHTLLLRDRINAETNNALSLLHKK
jgi:hypothetical protein